MSDIAASMEGRLAAGDIELAYETFGDPGQPPVVLVMGLAMQMIAWPDEFCGAIRRTPSVTWPPILWAFLTVLG